MTGRELIMYILTNHLEDEQVFENGLFVGFMTIEEAAMRFCVGPATVKAWVQRDLINSVTIAGTTYIPVNTKLPYDGYDRVIKANLDLI